MLGLSEPAANPFRDAPRRRFSCDMTAIPRTRRLAEERLPPPFTTLRMEKGRVVDVAAHGGKGIELQPQDLRNSAHPGAADGSAHGSVLGKVKVELEKFRSQAFEFRDQRRRGTGFGDEAAEVGSRDVPDLGLVVPRQSRVPGLGLVRSLPRAVYIQSGRVPGMINPEMAPWHDKAVALRLLGGLGGACYGAVVPGILSAI